MQHANSILLRRAEAISKMCTGVRLAPSFKYSQSRMRIPPKFRRGNNVENIVSCQPHPKMQPCLSPTQQLHYLEGQLFSVSWPPRMAQTTLYGKIYLVSRASWLSNFVHVKVSNAATSNSVSVSSLHELSIRYCSLLVETRLQTIFHDNLLDLVCRKNHLCPQQTRPHDPRCLGKHISRISIGPRGSFSDSFYLVFVEGGP